MPILSSSLRIVRDWLRFSVITLFLFVLARTFVIEAFTIPTSSMEATLLVGDFLFVDKVLFGGEIPGTDVRLPAIRDPRRGDLVVFRPPHDRDRVYVKRVVGLPGDTLRMLRKRLFVNGVPQEEAYVRYLDSRGDATHPGMDWQSDFLAAAEPSSKYEPSRDTWGPISVPPESFFVLGDNRDNSEDSRYWGFIGRNDIKGRPWMVYLSVGDGNSGSDSWHRRIRWDRVGRLVR